MNDFYYVDGEATLHILWRGGANSERAVEAGSEGGEGMLGEPYLEKTPNLMSNNYRAWIYDTREYEFTILAQGRTPLELETMIGLWNDWHDPELGEGYIKRLTMGGRIRCLSCIPAPPAWTFNSPQRATCEQRYIAACPWWRSEDETVVNGTIQPGVTIDNSGFEIGGTGGNFNAGAEADDGIGDDFTDWTETNDDIAGDTCEATATAQAGTYAVMLTFVTAESAIQSANLTVVPGETLLLSFYTRGDAAVAGQYQIYDVTNAADIQAKTTTAVTAAVYAEVTQSFTVPVGCVSLYIKFYSPAVAGVAYFDTVSLTRTSAFLGCVNGGDIPAWPVMTITGIVDTPVITNSDGDSITVNESMANADDEMVIDCRPWGENRRYVYYQVHAVGAEVPCRTSSDSQYITIPKGTHNLTLSATAGSPTIAVVYYAYYRSLY